ncbi:MAG: ATP cone domain-containing protein, partial [Carnobacterium sp.]
MVELTSDKLVSDEDASKVLNLLVVKRDGRSVRFDDKKIYEALMKAEKEVNVGTAIQTENEIKEIMDKINQEILARFTTDIKIYEIQNIVEHILLSEKKVELADRYINYRATRDFERAQSTDINFT